MASATRHRLAAVLATVADAVVEVDGAGAITSWNDAASRLFGHHVANASGTPVCRLFSETAGDAATRIGEVAAGVLASAAFESTARTGAGCARVSVSVAPVRAGADGVAGAVVAVRRVPDARRTEAKLALRAARYRALVERASEVLVVFTADGVLTYVSPQVGRPRPETLVGRQVFDFVHEADRVFARAVVASFAVVPGEHRPIVVRGTSPTGETLWWRVLVTNLLDDPAVRGLAGVVQDFTHQKALEDELAEYRDHDPVTGLLTPTAMKRELHPPDGATSGQVALAVIDVAGIASVQRDVGSATADAVRRAVAERLREVAAAGDLVARMHGNVFAVARATVTGEAAAQAFGDGLLGAVREPVVVRGTGYTLAATAGVALGDRTNTDALVRDADIARLDTIATGSRGAHVCSPAVRRATHDRLALIRRFRRTGLPTGHLDVELQRIVRLSDGASMGDEALLRWRENDGSSLPPAVVLPAAAAAGVLPALGDWMLQAACSRAAGDAGGDAFVSVNTSPAELSAEGFVERVHDAIEQSGLAPSRLVLEIGEPAAFREAGRRPVEVIERLAGLGVRIALDRFGGDQGSLASLRRLPVTMVKVAPALVGRLGADEDTDAIVASLLTLAGAVGVDAVAVGVETPDQHAALLRMGCVAAQGFLFDRAGAAEPFGADAATAPAARHRREQPAVDPRVVARIASLLRTGASLHTIAAALNREGLAHPRERRWHARAVAEVIATIPELTTRDRWTFL